MVEITSTMGALVPSVKSIPGPSASHPPTGAEAKLEDEAGAPSSAPSAMEEEEDDQEANETEPAPATEEERRTVEEEAISELDKESRCPICMQMIKDAFLTACGHSYCYMCIVTHLRVKRDCPCCGRYVAANQIFPNFALDKLLKKLSVHQFAKNASPFENLCEALRQGCEVSVKDLDSLLSLLVEKKKNMERDEAEANMQIMLEFLHTLRKRKLEELKQIQSDLLYIAEDINAVERHQTDLYQVKKFSVGLRMTDDDLEIARRSGQFDMLPGSDFSSICRMLHQQDASNPGSRNDAAAALAPVCPEGLMRHSTLGGTTHDPGQSGSILARKRRVHTQFNELQEYYLNKRRNWVKSRRPRDTDLNEVNMSSYHEGLKDFQSVLATFTRYSQLKVIADLRQGDVFHSTNVISSIEFDRDDQFFATAGVSRRIKVFEFSSVVNEPAEMHCPIVEMATRSKLSCLSWSKCSKNNIASCDYEGIVTIWDVNTRQSLVEYEEHEKRAWSVDFSRSEPSLLVSGSDDCKVKIWCTNQEASVLNINLKANICSVRFNPGSSFHVAAGSADHHVYYYDLRNISQPVHLLSAHRKAVSYVKFLSYNELASASTDSTLRLWDVNENSLVRTYRGHVNEKNFIGLSVNTEYIACGSETNEVIVYHKAISRPVEKNLFDNVFNTVMDIPGKTKDNLNVRKDLRSHCHRPGLAVDDNYTSVKPKAIYTLTREEKKKVCQWLRSVKFPDGYASNVGKCVQNDDCGLTGMKSHDCHVFMERLLPIAFKEFLPPTVWGPLTELSIFFQSICSSTVSVDHMVHLNSTVPILLCKLERIFPPSFFNLMEHLIVHLPYKAQIGGPVQYRWMYPFERYLYHLKNKIL